MHFIFYLGVLLERSDRIKSHYVGIIFTTYLNLSILIKFINNRFKEGKTNGFYLHNLRSLIRYYIIT